MKLRTIKRTPVLIWDNKDDMYLEYMLSSLTMGDIKHITQLTGIQPVGVIKDFQVVSWDDERSA